MKMKFSIALSLAIILAIAFTSFALADQVAQIVFTTDVCAGTVIVISYTTPAGVVTTASGLTPWTLDTSPQSALTFFYPATVTCNGATYNFQSVSPNGPWFSGAEGTTVTVTGHYLPPVVTDTTPPTITFVSRLPAANSLGWNNSNVTVAWSCSDNVGVLFPTVTQIVGTEGSALSATGTCTDTSGNTASDTQTGINIDKTAPSLSPVVSPNPVTLNGSATVNANASDALSGLDTVTCGSLDTGSVGLKSATCTATDKVGNFSSVSTSYNVQYAISGKCSGVAGHQILQPINTDGSSVFKKGSTVPVKFRVCGADGKAIGTPGVVTGFRLMNSDRAVLSTTSDTVFRSGNQQWIFNLSTKNLVAGNTYTYLIILNDGSTIQFQFSLK